MSPAVISLAACVLLVVAGIPAPGAAQIDRASISGTVTDPDGGGLPGVSVTVRNEANGCVRFVTTAANGAYVAPGLSQGIYSVVFQLQGFATLERPGVELLIGQGVVVDETLRLGSVEETVTVTAPTPLVDVTSKEIGGAIAAQELDDLPSITRDLAGFVSLFPGVVPNPRSDPGGTDSSPYVNGQHRRENSYNLDGASNDDDHTGNLAGGQVRTTLESIQEVQVLTSQFDAQYGRTQGGVFNAVTRSGSNEFDGTGYSYLQASRLNEKNFFVERLGVPQPDFTDTIFGFNLGGPIARDRANFFVSFERSRPGGDVAREFPSRPDQNFVTREHSLKRNWLAKLDWQVAPDQKLTFHYLRDYSPIFNQVGDTVRRSLTLEAAREQTDQDTHVSGWLDSVIGDYSFNTLQVSFVHENLQFGNPGFNANGQTFAAQRALDVSKLRETLIEGASTSASGRTNESLQIDDTFSLFVPDWHGDHDVRFGGQWSRRTVNRLVSNLANGQFFFDTDRPFDANDPSTYPELFSIKVRGPLGGEPSHQTPANNVLGLFAQNDWQPTRGLTLNLGLRWNWADITKDTNNFGPRLGTSWDAFGDGLTVVRGGWGRYYSRFPVTFFDDQFIDAVTLTSGFDESILDRFDQQFFIDLAAENGITTLNGLRDFLAVLIEDTVLFNRSPSVENPDRRQAHANTFTVGVEREFFSEMSVGVDFVHTKSSQILIRTDLNPLGTDPVSGRQFRRPNISVLDGEVVSLSSIRTLINAGESTYRAL